MLEAIKTHLSNQDNQLIIQGMSDKYQLSSLEYISLIDILFLILLGQLKISIMLHSFLEKRIPTTAILLSQG